MVGVVRYLLPQRAVDYVRERGRRLLCCVSKSSSSSSSEKVRFNREDDAKADNEEACENDEKESLLKSTSPTHTVMEENELAILRTHRESLSPIERTRHISDSSIITIDRIESSDNVSTLTTQLNEIENSKIKHQEIDHDARIDLEMEMAPIELANKSVGDILALNGAQINETPSSLSLVQVEDVDEVLEEKKKKEEEPNTNVQNTNNASDLIDRLNSIKLEPRNNNNNLNKNWKNQNNHFQRDINNNNKKSKQTKNQRDPDRSIIWNDRFKIVFDIYTPRPHFIILFKNPSNKKRVIDLDQEDLNKMFRLIDSFVKKFKLEDQNNMTLSFHTGCWATKAREFHAHISVELDIYLNIYNEYGISGIECYRKGAELNRGWIIKPVYGKPMSQTYIENVCNFMVANAVTSNQYRLEEIKKVEELGGKDLMDKTIMSTFFQIEFDSCEPKIHLESLKISNSVESRSLLIQEMCRIANECGFFQKSRGSHICLNLSSHERLSGYIRISGDLFYQLHPNPHQFLENYSNHTTYFIKT